MMGKRQEITKYIKQKQFSLKKNILCNKPLLIVSIYLMFHKVNSMKHSDVTLHHLSFLH